uniref:ECRG4 augurin precursor n=2 Tax=Otus sunia TaxID=257818 RepID=A0A8C8AMJ5_9STRI
MPNKKGGGGGLPRPTETHLTPCWSAKGTSPGPVCLRAMPPPSPRGALPGAAFLLLLLLLPLLCAAPDVSRGNKLKLMLQKREAPVATKPEVSVKETAAKEFLSSLRRQRRQLWDRSQPDVQQWYQQFLYLGFDEAKFEDDISYWTNLGRARNEYYGGYYQHHYDEDSPIGPRNPHTFRHGADKTVHPPSLSILLCRQHRALRIIITPSHPGTDITSPLHQDRRAPIVHCGSTRTGTAWPWSSASCFKPDAATSPRLLGSARQGRQSDW